MKTTNKIESVDFGFYVSANPTCLSCKFMGQDVEKLEPLLPQIKFYYFDAPNAKAILQEYKITSMPFLMMIEAGKVVSIMYEYPSLEALYYKLLKWVEGGSYGSRTKYQNS